ncbi:DUF4329 domain-containing protein [Escherichia coli]|nr:DUF4329 domain-containing protein [Escherichia coli]MCX1815297.1 DUF4329 domain-containing protein [Escherichia coli]
MSGKPAARQGDMTQYGGSIVQGSAGVRIGAPTGVACSVCPGGVTSGHPVNPLLGAKVLPGETDIALPGPLPFILSRTYSSYRTKTPAPVGSLGPGWKMPADIRLQLRDNTLILSDNGGRSLYFEHLFPGEDGYSRSESLWLVRGGVAKLDEGHRLAALWQALPEELRLSPHRYLATNSPQGPWWVLGWCERVPEADEVLPAPLPPYRVLTGLVDRFGRTQTFHHEAAGEFSGEITGVTDGAGRHFRLVLTTQAQRAEEARQSGLYYNRHRYYDPLQGRYITQDPIGLKGGWNLYTYPLSPVNSMDPLGLYEFKSKNIDDIGIFALAMCNGESINENKEYGGLICKKQGEYLPMNPISSNDNDSVDLRNIKCPEGSERVGDYHTHGFYSDDKGNKVTKENDVYDSLNFSSKDLTNSYMNGMGKKEYSSYLGTPNNTYLKYNPKAKGNGVTIIRQGSN